MRLKVLIFFFLLFSQISFLFSQTVLPDGRVVVYARIKGLDTIPVVSLPTCEIAEKIDPETLKRLQQYYKLRRDVKKVWPYARIAAEKLEEINRTAMKYKTERQRKAYIKSVEKQLKADFENDLKNFTFTQGKILIKLIDRETSNTSYDLVKELRGSFQAFFWQSLSRMFGMNLKTEYDSNGEDRTIESIVKQLEAEEGRAGKIQK